MGKIKLSSYLKAIPWATLLILLTGLVGRYPEPYDTVVKVLIVVVGYLAKLSPQTAVVMTPPPGRASDVK